MVKLASLATVIVDALDPPPPDTALLGIQLLVKVAPVKSTLPDEIVRPELVKLLDTFKLPFIP
jgi:hypothetical protein